MQTGDLVGTERGRASSRMEARFPQDLVGINVTDAGDKILTEEHRFQCPAAAPKDHPELSERELAFQRFDSHTHKAGEA